MEHWSSKTFAWVSIVVRPMPWQLTHTPAANTWVLHADKLYNTDDDNPSMCRRSTSYPSPLFWVSVNINSLRRSYLVTIWLGPSRPSQESWKARLTRDDKRSALMWQYSCALRGQVTRSYREPAERGILRCRHGRQRWERRCCMRWMLLHYCYGRQNRWCLRRSMQERSHWEKLAHLNTIGVSASGCTISASVFRLVSVLQSVCSTPSTLQFS